MILEPTSALLIITPILLPVAVEFGIDPLQFGSIVIFNLMIGLLTPPMGGVASCSARSPGSRSNACSGARCTTSRPC